VKIHVGSKSFVYPPITFNMIDTSSLTTHKNHYLTFYFVLLCLRASKELKWGVVISVKN